MEIAARSDRIDSAEQPASSQANLLVHEIYLSVQGESTWAGLPCTFIRLTGCPLRCTWCDTEYAFTGGIRMTTQEILGQVRELGAPLVEVTGGEPLAQRNSIILMEKLLADGRTVLLETSGALPTDEVPHEVRKILDVKCPSSGESERNDYGNLDKLAPWDEVKFVLGTREDYLWAVNTVRRFNLSTKCNAVLFSCVFGQLNPPDVVEWILADQLYDVRFQIQAHKVIWPPDMRGV